MERPELMMRSNLVKSFISDLTPYLGEYDDLSRFLSDVEDIIPPLTELDPLETLIRFKQITQKLKGKARRVMQEKPSTWEEVRNLLIRECADRMDIGSQIVAMERVGYMGTIYRTYEKLLYWQTRMLDKIDLGTDPPEEKILLKNSVRRRCYMQLRKTLPQACQGALTSRQCQSLVDAIQILHDEDFLTYDRYHEDRRIPNRHNNHPQKRDFNKPPNEEQTHNRHNQRQVRPSENQHHRYQNQNKNQYNERNKHQLPPVKQNYQRVNNRNNYSQQSRINKPKPWKFNPENFGDPVQYNATGDVEPMDFENFYLTPQIHPPKST